MEKPGKLSAGCIDLPSNCDICGKKRSAANHSRCSRIRQERHAQVLRNEEFDKLLMSDKKDVPDDRLHSMQQMPPPRKGKA